MSEFRMKCYSGREPRINVTKEFIEKSNFKLANTDNIKEKIKKENSFFGHELEVLVPYLTFEDAKEHYNEDYADKVESGEAKYEQITSLEETVQDFLDYMVFAWKKAEDERGLSASRSISKLGTWLWLLGRGDLEELINEEDLYNPYGSPALIKVCEELEIDVPDSLIEFSKHKC